jgi:hypothetical protein
MSEYALPLVNRIERVSQVSDVDILDRIMALMQGISASSTSTPSSLQCPSNREVQAAGVLHGECCEW